MRWSTNLSVDRITYPRKKKLFVAFLPRVFSSALVPGLSSEEDWDWARSFSRTFAAWWTPGGFLQCERQRAKFCGFVKLVVSFRNLKWLGSLQWLSDRVYMYFTAFLSWNNVLATFYSMQCVSISTQIPPVQWSFLICFVEEADIWNLPCPSLFVPVFLIACISSMKWSVGIKKWFHLRWVNSFDYGFQEQGD